MNHDSVVAVWKPQGWTPLKAVHAFKNQFPTYANETVAYAGRLDPMAEGVLLLLIGDENKKRKAYENLPKTYEAECIFGITTDSLDALGLITSHNFKKIEKEKIAKTIKSFIGKQAQTYPIYSSKAVQGKSLYWWARQNRIAEITIPQKSIEIFSLRLLKTDDISIKTLYEQVHEKINRVEGDFRQEEILRVWKNFTDMYTHESVQNIKISVTCSSGTYIRQLAADIGAALGIVSFALSITRTNLGEYSQIDASDLTISVSTR